MSGSDPMVPRIAMMKALCGHQPKAAATHASKISSCIVAGRGQEPRFIHISSNPGSTSLANVANRELRRVPEMPERRD
jgi:hypothetical protein